MKHKILSDFEMQTDYPVQARRPDLVLIHKKRKKNLPSIGFYGGSCEFEGWQKAREMPRPCQRAEKAVEHEGNSDINCSYDP